MGRLAADPEVRFSAGQNATCVANFNLAVDKKFKHKDNPDAPTADFFRITAFGKLGEFCQNYLHKGTKVVINGRIENNNYTDANGKKVYRDQIIAESIEFAESKKAAEQNDTSAPATADSKGFVNIPESVTNDLPF